MTRNPPAVPADTSPAAWCAQMRAIKRRTTAERLEEWERLNRAAAEMEAASVRRAHPGIDDRGVFLLLVRRRYGDAVARAVWPDAGPTNP